MKEKLITVQIKDKLSKTKEKQPFLEPNILILSSDIYYKLRTELGRSLSLVSTEFFHTQRYLGLEICLLPSTKKTNVIEFAISLKGEQNEIFYGSSHNKRHGY